MSVAFVPCGECARHVKQGDSVCPFCGARVDADAPVRAVRMAGASRAALFAAGAGTLLGTADCGSSDDNSGAATADSGDVVMSAEGSGSGSGAGSASGSSTGSGSGSSAGTSAGSSSGSTGSSTGSSSGGPTDAAADVPMVMALYGAMVIPDAGTPDSQQDAATPPDASHDAPSAIPLYGAVPIRDI